MYKAIELSDSLCRMDTFTEYQRSVILKAASELLRLAVLEHACAHYLKEGETPSERIARELADNQSLCRLLAEERTEAAALRARIAELEATQPERQPLTDDQINDGRRALRLEPDDLPEPWAFLQGVRFAEAAHGIKEPEAPI